MKIFIVGCAKTGTTLLQRCFFAFEDIFVLLGESTLDSFLYGASHRGVMIGKRSNDVVFSNDLFVDEIERQLKLVKEHDIRLICMIRNREDTLRSDNNWVLPARYDACMRHLEEYRQYIQLELEYEDLVNDADGVQERIEELFGLKSKHKFSEYPDFVPKKAFQITDHNERYKARRIGEAV